jgi:hypothetical protein
LRPTLSDGLPFRASPNAKRLFEAALIRAKQMPIWPFKAEKKDDRCAPSDPKIKKPKN